jgi:hypothetical protein
MEYHQPKEIGEHKPGQPQLPRLENYYKLVEINNFKDFFLF